MQSNRCDSTGLYKILARLSGLECGLNASGNNHDLTYLPLGRNLFIEVLSVFFWINIVLDRNAPAAFTLIVWTHYIMVLYTKVIYTLRRFKLHNNLTWTDIDHD